jgi:CRISPR-associated protein Cas1
VIVYVQEPGCIVGKKNEGIEVRKQGELLYKIPLIGLERLVIIGYSQVTTQALTTLSAQGIDVVYLSRNGQVLFTLRTPTSDNVFLRLAQMKRFEDKPYCLHLAKQLVTAKLSSQIGFIKDHRWTGDFNWKSRTNTIDTLTHQLDTCQNPDELRGMEGSASRTYFECFGTMLTKMSFSGRSRRPANDQVNAMLNFGYTLLTNECAYTVETAGLDPAIGFLHGLTYGRQSLALDVVELFRVDIVDRLVVRLVNWGMLRDSDFISDAKIGYRFTEQGLRQFLSEYEKHMNEGEASHLKQIRNTCEKLKSALLNGTDWEV